MMEEKQLRRDDRTPLGITILMWAVVICSLGTIAYYLGDYIAARSELDVARRECQALEKQLPGYEEAK